MVAGGIFHAFIYPFLAPVMIILFSESKSESLPAKVIIGVLCPLKVK